MLSKLRLAFSSSHSSSPSSASLSLSQSNTDSSTSNTLNTNTATTSINNRARSSTIPAPTLGYSHVHPIVDTTTATTTTTTSSHSSSTPASRSVSSSYNINNALDRQTSASSSASAASSGIVSLQDTTLTTTGTTSTAPAVNINATPSTTTTTPSSSISSQLSPILLSSSASSSPGSNYTPTPQVTPKSANFPNTPFSTPSTIIASSSVTPFSTPSSNITTTPATPPRAVTATSSINSPMSSSSSSTTKYHNNQTFPPSNSTFNGSSYHPNKSNNSSLNNSPAIIDYNQHAASKENRNTRKKTKSTTTLPSWIISSFSSSSSLSPKENSKREIQDKINADNAASSSSALTSRAKYTEFKQNPAQQKISNSYLLLSNMPSGLERGAAATKQQQNAGIAFPLRVETGRRGSLPITGLTVEDPSIVNMRPRSPSMLSHNYDNHNINSVVSSPSLVASSSVSSPSSGLYFPPSSEVSPHARAYSPQQAHAQSPHFQLAQQQHQHQQPFQQQQQQQHPQQSQRSPPSLPSSPSTPIRLGKPPLKAPSPLSTTSSPYQIIDYEISPIHSPSTYTQIDSPGATAGKPGRRKSILGKRRNFTEVWNNSSINPNNMGNSNNTNKQDELRSSVSGTSSNNKKKSNKGHNTKDFSSSSSKMSGDYSSLLAASKKVFSKSVDDLTSFTKHSLLSSPSATGGNNAINYSRPRKSVDERRNSIYPNLASNGILASSPGAGIGTGATGNGRQRQYGFADMQNASTSRNMHMHSAVNGGNSFGNDAEEELDGLSSGSSASLAHSPMPSDESAHSMPVYSTSQQHPNPKQNKSNLIHSQQTHHHIFKVPKLPSVIPSGKHGISSKKEGKATLQHRKAVSSTSTAQVQLPPSISLPGGLCIESTASILASSMDDHTAEQQQYQHILPETPKRSTSASIPIKSIAPGSNAKKRKSIDARSVKSESGILLLSSSPGLAPSFILSPATSARSAPSPTIPSLNSPSPSASPSTSTAASSFPKRPPLATKKSSGSASLNSLKSNTTARIPSFGSPKASSPLALANPPTLATSNTTNNGRQRSSQIILIEGVLQRKTDHRSHIKASSWSFPFSSSSGSMFSSTSTSSQSNKGQDTSSNAVKQRPSPGRNNSESNMREIDLSKGWKPFYAILRGTNLYLYKLSSDLSWQTKTCFSNYSASRSAPSSTSLSSSSSSMPSAFMPSTPLQQASDLDEDRIKASISNHSKAAYLLPIANSTVRVIHSATRGDVFELFTEEGEVAILQTSNKSEANRWIQVLSSTGLTIANKRASYLETIGKLDTINNPDQHGGKPDTILERNSESHERSFSSTNDARKLGGKVFGVPLEEIIQREGGKIPRIAEVLFAEIENRGLLETGIYRVPGENRVMQAMRAKIDSGSELDFTASPSFSDPHNLASLTKLWLRELPEIISPDFYSAFIRANNVEGYEERLCAVRDLVWSLPAPSFHLLDKLCEHLHLIAEHELENQMHASNLAIVFAPTILRPPEGVDSYAILMSNLGKAAKVVASLIVQHNWIFSGQEVEEDAEPELEKGVVHEEVAVPKVQSTHSAHSIGQGSAVLSSLDNHQADSRGVTVTADTP